MTLLLNWRLGFFLVALAAIFLSLTAIVVNSMASVGEIVSFMGFGMLLIGRLKTAASFISSLFFKMPALEEFFAILDQRSSVPEKVGAPRLWAPRGEVAFDERFFRLSGQ